MIHNYIIHIRFILSAILFSAFIIWLFKTKGERASSRKYNSVDAIVPAFNEEICISRTIRDLLTNKYIRKVICVNDGSTDNTGKILENLRSQYPDKLIVIHLKHNKGKAAAINEGLKHVEADYVFLTDADTRIPNDDGIGYLISHIENGADAAGGVAASDLTNAGILPKIRASVKAFYITYRRCGMDIIGGAPFCISGSCGLYKTNVLKAIGGVPNRTKVEDLDLTWTLVEKGYKVRQSARCVVFAQEANNFGDELRRWKRWISGYAVCMRLHKRLLLSRFGIVILFQAIIPILGIPLFILPFIINTYSAFKAMFWWELVLIILSSYCAKLQKNWSIMLFSPLSPIYFFLACFVWYRWGIPALITGKEPKREKVRRY